MNKIVIISSGQPFGNPRMVKEAMVFSKKGMEVSVIYCSLNEKYQIFDEQIKNGLPQINWVNVVVYKDKIIWKKLRKKIWELFYNFFGDFLNSGIKSYALYSQELVKSASQIKADLYVGHNLGALHAVVNASKLHKAKSSFDFEDFHRGETDFGLIKNGKEKHIEDKYVPFLNFATCASPLIELEYKKIYPRLKFRTINNSFPLYYRSEKIDFKLTNHELKLFWFSQFIGKQRGLEDVIKAIGLVQDGRIKLSLLGSIDESLKSYFKSIAIQSKLNFDQLIFLDPVSESELVHIGQQHHVGIASEVVLQENRNYCLTNKIFIYLLSKNAVLFSNTKAQKSFFSMYTSIGYMYSQSDIQQIANYLKTYLDNPCELEKHRKNSERLGNQLNWENESYKLIEFYKIK